MSDGKVKASAMASAAESKALAARIEVLGFINTPLIAARIRRLRVDERRSWRQVALAMQGPWSPPDNQVYGMFLCERAAEMHGEDYMKMPWNEEGPDPHVNLQAFVAKWTKWVDGHQVLTLDSLITETELKELVAGGWTEMTTDG